MTVSPASCQNPVQPANTLGSRERLLATRLAIFVLADAKTRTGPSLAVVSLRTEVDAESASICALHVPFPQMNSEFGFSYVVWIPQGLALCP